MNEEGRPRKEKGTTGTVLRAMPGHPTPLPAQILHHIPTPLPPRPPEQVQKPASPVASPSHLISRCPQQSRLHRTISTIRGSPAGRCLPCLRVAFPVNSLSRGVCARGLGEGSRIGPGENLNRSIGRNCNRGPAIPRKAPSELAQPEAQAGLAPAGRRALDVGGPVLGEAAPLSPTSTRPTGRWSDTTVSPRPPAPASSSFSSHSKPGHQWSLWNTPLC